MNASVLLDELTAAGLHVEQYPNWAARGYSWKGPVGVMHHHTALPVPYPVSKLAGPLRIKCNINTKPDGTVWLVAYKACNYSSGKGSSVVLGEVQTGVTPWANAVDRGLVDDMGGNKWFWNFENDHPGDGGPLPQVQFDAIVEATRVVVAHFGLTGVISHAEWTARKIDPYWNNDRRAIESIRSALEDDMDWSQIYKRWTAEDIDEMASQGLFGGDPQYYKDDIGTYAHTVDWVSLTTDVLANKSAQTLTAGDKGDKGDDGDPGADGKPVTLTLTGDATLP